MKKRNFILLIILMFVILGILYVSFKPTTPDDEGNTNTNQDTNFFSNIFPLFGNKNKNSNNTNTENPADISGYVPPTEGKIKDMILYKISSVPVAGYGLYYKERFVDVPLKKAEEENTEIISGPSEDEEIKDEKPVAPETEEVLSIRYVDKKTGNIYQTFADKIFEQKYSNTIILNLHEAIFSSDGENVIMRYLKPDNKTIASWAGYLPKEVLGADSITTSDVSGSFLPDNITDLSVAKDSSKIFYLFNTKDYTIGISANGLGEKKTQVFDSSYSEWLSEYVNQNTITLTTKAGSGVPGFIYKVNPNRKDFEKVLGGISGLTTLTSPNGNLVLYADDGLNLHLYNTGTEETKRISIKTLPEKCTWREDSTEIYCAMPKDLQNASYPDSWYMGEISFSDQIWKIDAETLNTGLIIDPLQTDGGEDIDGIKLTFKDGYLFFVNKKDNFLWELKIK